MSVADLGESMRFQSGWLSAVNIAYFCLRSYFLMGYANLAQKTHHPGMIRDNETQKNGQLFKKNEHQSQ